MRPRKKNCIACGENPIMSTETIANTDYKVICNRVVPEEISERITVKEYSQLRGEDHVLIDVRDKTQFGICSLPNSLSKSLHLRRSDVRHSLFRLDAGSGS